MIFYRIILFQVVVKFYGIRKRDMVSSSDTTTEEKCQCLLHDSPDNWIYSEDGETSTMKYIVNFIETFLYHILLIVHHYSFIFIFIGCMCLDSFVFKFTIQASLEDEKDALKSSIDKLQNNLRMVNVLERRKKWS